MTHELTLEECELLALDGTGRDINHRFPYTYENLTEIERMILNALTGKEF